MSINYHIVCPYCAGVNRVPRSGKAHSAKCGKCKKPLFQGRPAQLSDFVFQRFIERNDIPVVVDFWAEWCAPCRMMASVFERAASEMEPAVRFAKIDTDKEREVAAKYTIRSIPSLLIFYKGKEVARKSGAMSYELMMRWVRKTIAGIDQTV